MIVSRLKKALEKSIVGTANPFITYKQFALRYGFDANYCPSWANRIVLDEVANQLKSDPNVGMDLTFLIRNQKKKYPSVIDGKPYDPENSKQKLRAREVADAIIKKYKLSAANPYRASK